jgi:hypothetical protein
MDQKEKPGMVLCYSPHQTLFNVDILQIVGSAAISLLKGASQHNSYAHAVNSTYLMATGAQRQIFSILGTLGITMGYTSVIYQPPEPTNKPDADVSPLIVPAPYNLLSYP